ncbi:MAG: glycoside hydrolase family 92 protein, partial [Bacteroidota bacterium]
MTNCFRIFFLLFSFFFLSCNATDPYSPPTPLSYVNPLIGTAPSTTETAQMHSESGSELRGQTFPAVGVPFGMTQWTPQTRATEQKCLSPYYYQDTRIQGFRGSRWMSGSCTQDYGSVTIMPTTGALKVNPEERSSAFSHDQEIVTPSYYAVTLSDYNIRAEVTATSRAGMLRFTPNSDSLNLIIEPNSDEGEGFVEIFPERNEIVGFNPVHRIYQGWGESAGFSGYFVIQVEDGFSDFGVWHGEDLQLGETKLEAEGQSVGAYITMAVDQAVKVKVGTSFTSINQARKNLEAEISHWNFEQVRQTSEEAWLAQLNKAQV